MTQPTTSGTAGLARDAAAPLLLLAALAAAVLATSAVWVAAGIAALLGTGSWTTPAWSRRLAPPPAHRRRLCPGSAPPPPPSASSPRWPRSPRQPSAPLPWAGSGPGRATRPPGPCCAGISSATSPARPPTPRRASCGPHLTTAGNVRQRRGRSGGDPGRAPGRTRRVHVLGRRRPDHHGAAVEQDQRPGRARRAGRPRAGRRDLQQGRPVGADQRLPRRARARCGCSTRKTSPTTPNSWWWDPAAGDPRGPRPAPGRSRHPAGRALHGHHRRHPTRPVLPRRRGTSPHRHPARRRPRPHRLSARRRRLAATRPPRRHHRPRHRRRRHRSRRPARRPRPARTSPPKASSKPPAPPPKP